MMLGYEERMGYVGWENDSWGYMTIHIYESQHTTVLGIRKRILCNILQLETHIPAGGS